MNESAKCAVLCGFIQVLNQNLIIYCVTNGSIKAAPVINKVTPSKLVIKIEFKSVYTMESFLKPTIVVFFKFLNRAGHA